MNHLAHCFLSFGNDDLLLGNFIGDYVKGHDWQYYPKGVQTGLLLHRRIDAFTDSHERVRACTGRIRLFAGRFAGPVCDILFDHLLVRSWSQHSNEPLETFTHNTYAGLQRRASEMPAILQERLPRMISGDFLTGYAYREGLEFVFERFVRRLPGSMDYRALLDFFEQQLPAFDADFAVFFPALVAEAQQFVAAET